MSEDGDHLLYVEISYIDGREPQRKPLFRGTKAECIEIANACAGADIHGSDKIGPVKLIVCPLHKSQHETPTK